MRLRRNTHARRRTLRFRKFRVLSPVLDALRVPVKTARTGIEDEPPAPSDYVEAIYPAY